MPACPSLGSRGDVQAALFALLTTAILHGCDGHQPSSEATVPPVAVPATGGPIWFKEAAVEQGLGFVHQSGHRERYLMPEIMAGGAALVDIDGDGDLDVYLIQSGSVVDPTQGRPANRLYRNLGDGRFEDITEGSGAGDRGYGMGVACGDYDNDGDVDLYVTNLGPNVLLQNDGTGHFMDVTAEARIGHPGFGTSAAFVDYDNDGDLDLIVLNYLNWSITTELECYNDLGEQDYCSPQNYRAPARDVLYRNEGNGTFTDVTEPAGLDKAFGTGLGLLCGDFNNDGWVDIFVANDGMPNQLWVNQGDGTFRDEALAAGCAVDQEGMAKAGMGVTAADIDDDGDLDLLVGNLAKESDSFFRNGGGYFTDSTAVSGLAAVSRPFTRFGMAWVDFDNDGYLDLYQANGRVMRQSTLHADDPFAEPNLLYRGAAEGRFKEFTPRGGTAQRLIATSRAAAFGDVNQDGGIDVLVLNRDAQAHLLLNVVPNRGRWISFKVIDEHGRDALGATVSAVVASRRVTYDVRAAYSYLASNDPRVHIGVGDQTTVTDVSVRWTDGAIESFGDYPANQRVTLRRGAGLPRH